MYQIHSEFRWRNALNPAAPLCSVLERFDLFKMLLRNDLSAKFRHSILGVLWLFIPPVCILLLYVYVFSFIFKLRWPEQDVLSVWGFGLTLYTGVVIYTAFSESLMGALSVLVARPAFIKRIPFPLELMVLSPVTANLIVATVMLLLIYALSLCSGGNGSWAALLYFPILLLPLAFFTAGCVFFASSLGVFFRNLSNLMGILLMLWFFATPIFYSYKMVPVEFRWVVDCNPLTPVVLNLRKIFLYNQTPDWQSIAAAYVTALIVYQAGWAFFSYMRRRFADAI